MNFNILKFTLKSDCDKHSSFFVSKKEKAFFNEHYLSAKLNVIFSKDVVAKDQNVVVVVVADNAVVLVTGNIIAFVAIVVISKLAKIKRKN